MKPLVERSLWIHGWIKYDVLGILQPSESVACDTMTSNLDSDTVIMTEQWYANILAYINSTQQLEKTEIGSANSEKNRRRTRTEPIFGTRAYIFQESLCLRKSESSVSSSHPVENTSPIEMFTPEHRMSVAFESGFSSFFTLPVWVESIGSAHIQVLCFDSHC